MHRETFFCTLLCLLTSGHLVVAQETATTMSPVMNFTAGAANASDPEVPATVSSSPSSPSSPSSQSSPSSSSSPVQFSPSSSSSSTSAFSFISSSDSSPSPSISPDSSSPSSPASPSSSSAAADMSTNFSPTVSSSTAVKGDSPSSEKPTTSSAQITEQSKMTDVMYLPIVAAVVSGCGLLVLLLSLFLVMALVYRHLGKEDSTMISRKKKQLKTKDNGDFYTGLEPQSGQHLVSSMSVNSFASSPSDAQLNNQLPASPGVHYNRGYDVDHHPSGANGHEDGYKPIQIVAADVNPRPNSTSRV